MKGQGKICFGLFKNSGEVLSKLKSRGFLVVNASDSGSRVRGFEPHSGQTVLCP